MKRGIVRFCRSGSTGNVFVILARADGVLTFLRKYGDAKKMWNRVTKCDSYEKALSIICEYVHLIETDVDCEFDYEVEVC